MARNILIKPIISEKAEGLSDKQGQYTFVVDRKANKIEIRKAVEKMYSVNVESVNTLTMPGKSKKRFTRAGVQSGRVS
ncbi:MAG: 50S ribosomal protein L23, partial [Saprospiraceae bacterium]|nr:50S ribosomal protein L23 [Saprospiraceae bacterium]